jgi:hypothetical protein
MHGLEWVGFGLTRPNCPHSGTAHSRARRRLVPRLERLNSQPLTPNLRWHAACTLSCGGIGQESPVGAASTQRRRTEGVVRVAPGVHVILLLTTVIPLGECLS